MPRPLVTSRISNCPLAHRDRPGGRWRQAVPASGIPPRSVFRDPGGSAPPGARPWLAPRAVTQRAAARAPARLAWRGHSPVGGARRAGGAADRGSSRGRPRASPSRPGQPHRDTRRQRQLRDGHSAGSLPLRPATSSRPPAPSFFPGLQSPPSTRSPPAPPPFSLLSSHCPSRERLGAQRQARRPSWQPEPGRDRTWEGSPREPQTERLRRDTGGEKRVSRTDSSKEGGHRSRRVHRTAARPWHLGGHFSAGSILNHA